jgi:hypothetical protein
VIVFATAMGVLAPEVARSSCAAPEIMLRERGPFSSGDEVHVEGRYWTGDCNDVETCTKGCLGTKCSGLEPVRPATGITLGIRSTPRDGLGTIVASDVDAGEDLTFDVVVIIPSLPPGSYRIEGQSAQTAGWTSEPFRVTG